MSDQSEQEQSEQRRGEHNLESRRPPARVIFERVQEDAEEELARPKRALAPSALFAGFTIGASSLAFAAGLMLLDSPNEKFIAALLYPIGYVGAIIGRAHLFTENTLYPVVNTLEDRSLIPATARLWAVVLLFNLVGAAAFGLVIVDGDALPEGVAGEFAKLGDDAAARDFATTFWSAVLAGWLLAMVAWLVEAGDHAIGQIAVVWFFTLPVGLLSFDHSIASAVTVFGGLFDGRIGLAEAAGWEATTILGNALGGVVIVALVNYGQVAAQAMEQDEESGG